ncbi:MAG: hypothetical protein GY775_17020, partial [Candidatus Scalindua sp.]|nr:hypothetical protein [Candidatus Scalindua sp.]
MIVLILVLVVVLVNQVVKSRFIWNHCHSKVINGKTYTICNHCKDQSWILNSSTSTAKYHLTKIHYDKLSEEERIELTTKARGEQKTTSTSKLPVRSSAAHLMRQVGHQSQKGREWDVLLSQAIISGSLPYNILDNVQFGVLVESLSSNAYRLPSRGYMNRTVVPIVYRACQDVIKDRLKHVPHIALTTDAWKSISKQSYITVTSHMIDDEGILHNFLLDTTEITVRHTSDNLHKHIQTVLQTWGMETDDITINYNNTNPNDIEAEDIEEEVDFLREFNYYTEDEDEDFDNNEQVEDNTEHDNTELTEQLEDDDETQMSQFSQNLMTQQPDSRSDVRNVITHTQPQPPGSRSDARNVITQPPQAKKKLSFTTDNAADITKALRGKYQWLGCAAHHTNLVIKHGFKNVKSAAKLLKKCKCIVKSINHSNPLIYGVRKYQEELDLPPCKLLQEVTTRWWSILIMLTSIDVNIVAI